VQQDFEIAARLSSSRRSIRKAEYLGGRFVGAIAVLVVVLSSIAIGAAVGLFLPGIDPDRVGPIPPRRLCDAVHHRAAAEPARAGRHLFCVGADAPDAPSISAAFSC
jgi:hypothetical protein